MLFFDLETHLIEPGRTFPPIVCAGVHCDRAGSYLATPHEVISRVRRALSDGEPIANHWIAFDLGCIVAAAPELARPIFEHYRRGLVHCTQVRGWLIDAAHGCLGKLGPYSLSRLHERAFGVALDKGEDTWRKRYHELDGIPFEQWPEDARTYPVRDVEAAANLYAFQGRWPDMLEDATRQAAYYFGLQITAGWGLVTDPVKVDEFEARYRARAAELSHTLRAAGLVRANGTRDTKRTAALVTAAYGGRPPTTDKGNVKCDAATCRDSGDPALAAYGELGPTLSQINKNLPILRSGIVHTKFGFAATGRTTSGDGETTADDGRDHADNVQNLDGKSGVRECFVPRPGFLFGSADYGGLELCTLAQVEIDLFGSSRLADVLNAGEDAHTSFACSMLGIEYAAGVALHDALDPAFEQVRDVCKIGNFGFPGGLGAGAFVAYAARKSGGKVHLTEDEARRYRRAWFERWGLDRYFAHVDRITTTTGTVTFLRSGRIRGRVGYTDGCNGYFQALGSDVAKSALFAVVASTFDPSSPLWGSHAVNFVHDSIDIEAPEQCAAEAAEELGAIMVREAKRWLPDVRIKAAPLLARYMSKKARPLRDASGRLIPWG